MLRAAIVFGKLPTPQYGRWTMSLYGAELTCDPVGVDAIMVETR
jgi:hypothetical protein